MFDRFTEKARKVMTLARQEAQNLRNDYIGTEHLLLGLVGEGSGVAAAALKELGVEPRAVRAEVNRLVEHGTSPVGGSQLPFTPRGKRVLERALEEALGLGHNYVGTEHLLLGVLAERDGPAAVVLHNLGVRADDVRAKVIELLGSPPALAPPGGKAKRTSAWESIPPSGAVDWAKISRLRAAAQEMLGDRVEWAVARVDISLMPRKGRWRCWLTASLHPEGELEDQIHLSVLARLEHLEEDLPRLVDCLVKSIETGEAPED